MGGVLERNNETLADRKHQPEEKMKVQNAADPAWTEAGK